MIGENFVRPSDFFVVAASNACPRIPSFPKPLFLRFTLVSRLSPDLLLGEQRPEMEQPTPESVPGVCSLPDHSFPSR